MKSLKRVIYVGFCVGFGAAMGGCSDTATWDSEGVGTIAAAAGVPGSVAEASPQPLHAQHGRVAAATTDEPRALTARAGVAPGCALPVHLTSNGGRFTGGAVHLHPVLWGTGVNSGTTSTINSYLNALATSDVLSMVHEEYGFPGAVVDAATVITPHNATGTTVTDADIRSELTWQSTNSKIPSSGNYVYLVHFPSTVTPYYPNGDQTLPICTPRTTAPNQGSFVCAYHHSLKVNSSQNLNYAVLPDSASGPCSVHWCGGNTPTAFDGMTAAESHEIIETLTDPTGTGFLVRQGSVNVPARNLGDACLTNNDEIGDICEGASFERLYSIGAATFEFWFQTEWSNKANACVAAPGARGDIDGDGLSDLVLTDISTNGVVTNNLPIAFSQGNNYRGVIGTETIGNTNFGLYSTQAGAKPVAGDFDGDGFADVALAGGVGWNTMPTALSNGDGTFRGHNNGELPGNNNLFELYAAAAGAQLVAGDFNGDGFSDIAVVGIAGVTAIPIAYSNGNGQFIETVLGPTSGVGSATFVARSANAKAVSGDFNCDGLADIALVATGTTSIAVAYSNGDGTFHTTDGVETSGNTQFTVYAGQPGATPVAGDFNGDCYADIALTSGANWRTIPVAFGNGDGTFHGTNLAWRGGDSNFPVYAAQAGARPVAGDFNGDGLSDIALTQGVSWRTMPLALSNGDGTFFGLNTGVVTGNSSFPSTASLPGVKAVTW